MDGASELKQVDLDDASCKLHTSRTSPQRFVTTFNQVLSVFFAATNGTRALCTALLPAIRVVLSSAPGSPDATVHLDSLVTFVVGNTKPQADSSSEAASAACAVHEELALALCCEAALQPHEAEGRALPKAVCQLSLQEAKSGRLAVLAELLRRVTEAGTTDKQAVKSVARAADRIAQLQNAAVASSIADEEGGDDEARQACGCE